MTPCRFRLVPALLLILAACLASHAQTSPDREPREAAAREITRRALLDLRSTSSPTPEDYRAALVMFTFAAEIDPTSTDIIRRQIEAAHNAGDQDAVVAHTRALLLLDPSDTVATLRLITALIARDHNTAESRLAAYDQIVADKSLDASIRSRLALDAALLLREKGDENGFKDRLIKALQLDPTHKEAASLAATYFAQRVPNDAPGRIDLLINLLKADPLDPNIHLSISRELVVAGAYEAALRFHTNALNISSVLARPNEQAVVENYTLQWYVRGPAKVVTTINDAIAVERDTAARNIRKLIENRRPTDEAPKPEEINAPLPVSSLYLLAADASGDRAALTGGFREFTAQVDRLVEKLRSPRTRGTLTEQEAGAATLEALVELNMLRLWLDVDAAAYNQKPEIVRGIRNAYPQGADLLDALWELRAGRPQETIDRCAPLLPNRVARLATALAHEALGNSADAIELYRLIVESDPLQPVAAWSSSRIAKLGGKPVSPRAPELARLVADPRVPAWMDRMATEPNRFIRITATLPSQEINATDPVSIRLTITNQSPIPLALGPDRPLSSRFLLAPKMDGASIDRLIRPEVIDADRRLRLLPRESLTIDVWPGPGQTGWVLDSLANRNLRLRWNFIQGFSPGESGGFKPGPMCLTVETQPALLRPLAASSLSAMELATSITGAPIESIHRLACVARASALQPIFNPDPPPVSTETPRRGQPPPQPPVVIPPIDLKPAASAFTLRYQTLPPTSRALLLCILPHAGLAPDLASFDAAVRNDQDPLARCLFILTRISDPADETMKVSLTSEDARIRTVAESALRRLNQPAKAYPKLVPDDLRAPAPTRSASEQAR
jgi:tetratricopeptide (TPR) repeat protein